MLEEKNWNETNLPDVKTSCEYISQKKSKGIRTVKDMDTDAKRYKLLERRKTQSRNGGNHS